MFGNPGDEKEHEYVPWVSRRTPVFLALSVATTTLLRPALAQDMPGRTVPVEVRGEEHTKYHILDANAHEVGSCQGKCTLKVVPGTYTFVADETEGAPGAKALVQIGGPAVVEVTPGSKNQRAAGLALRLGGGLAVLVGVIGTAVSAAPTCPGCNDPRSPVPWLVVALAGVGTGLAGLIVTATSSTTVDARPAKPPSAVTFGLAPLENGASVGLTLSF